MHRAFACLLLLLDFHLGLYFTGAPNYAVLLIMVTVFKYMFANIDKLIKDLPLMPGMLINRNALLAAPLHQINIYAKRIITIKKKFSFRAFSSRETISS